MEQVATYAGAMFRGRVAFLFACLIPKLTISASTEYGPHSSHIRLRPSRTSMDLSKAGRFA